MTLFGDYIFQYNSLGEFSQNFYGTSEAKHSVGFLRTICTELEQIWVEVKKAYDACKKGSVNQIEDAHRALAKEKFKTASDMYCTLRGQLLDKIDQLQTPVSPESPPGSKSSNPTEPNFVKLPPIDIEPFAGDYKSWPSFRDMFQSIFLEHPKLTDVQKLYHLRAKCKSEAFSIIDKFPLTSDNFCPAWDALKNQYENKRMLINTQLKVLFSLPTISLESATAIRRLHATVNDCLTALKNHEVDTTNWDPILIFMISSKLPNATLSLWEQNIKNPREIPTWSEMDEFLNLRFRSLEAIADVKTQSSSRYSEKPSTMSVSGNKRVNSFYAQTPAFSCKLCSEQHPLRQCKTFLSLNYAERLESVKKHRHCFNCLATSHSIKNCHSKTNCSHCNQRHHSLLHPPTKTIQSTDQETHPLEKVMLEEPLQYQENAIPQATNEESTPFMDETATLPQVQTFFTTHNRNIILATALVKIVINKTPHFLRALIDPGSEASFILEAAVSRLRLPTSQTTAQISGMGSVTTAHSTRKCLVNLESRLDMNFYFKLEALVLKKLTGLLPSQPVSVSTIPTIDTHTLADPEFHQPGRIELVLGADVYPSILRNGIKTAGANCPIAQNTVFGWILSGPCAETSESVTRTVVSFFNDVSLNEDLQKFWETEEVVPTRPSSFEDIFCENLFTSTTTRAKDGKYIVHLPFKENFPHILKLGPSRSKALTQFLRMEKSFSKRPAGKIAYAKVFNEYKECNHLTMSDSYEIIKDSTYLSFYLPHHGVLKPESTSTKLRVVFNASSETSSGNSLNDILYVGPRLQQDLSMVIHRWRRYPFVFNADIEKMYRQIWVHPPHCEFQRVLFRENESDTIQDYRLQTVTFGLNCAPYLAIRTLLQLAKDEGKKFPIASSAIDNDFYVDDLLSGAYDIESAKVAQTQLLDILKSGGFPLKKWTANSPELLQNIPHEDRLFGDLLSLDDSSTIKALGISWSIHDDFFTFRLKNFETSLPLTKRKVLSSIAKLFDPAGWLAPTIIFSKILMQEIWSDKTDWDEAILPCRATKWSQFLKELPLIESFKIPRWISYFPRYNIEYHGFCDASQQAMAAAFYVRVVDDEGGVHTNLISAKTKVAPLKVLSLPRLELCGAVLLAKLANSLVAGLQCENYSLTLWTDSTIVLSWLKRSPSHWKTFIANRVSQIIENVKSTPWRHISSEDNPADLATRGILPSMLCNNDLWWKGPSWFNQPSTLWPISEHKTPENVDMEEKPLKTFLIQNVVSENLLDRFSSLERAFRVYCYVIRFWYRTHPKKRQSFNRTKVLLDHNEIQFVKIRFLQVTQRAHFFLEFQSLKANKPISSKSPLIALNPFLDSNDLIRSNGRISNSSLSYSEKFPIILPYSCSYSKLLVRSIHKTSLHGGAQLMLYLVRKEFWIPRVKNLIKSEIFKCKPCFLYKRKTQEQIMGSLPPERVTFIRPFAHVGVDYAGHFELKVRKGRFYQSTKAYVSIFVCFSSRAIHLEVVSDLSSDAFLAAFARFFSRRGIPSCIYSDNGTNFVGAKSLLDRDIKLAIDRNASEASKLHAVQGISWKFIPPGAPHMGGLWEVGVKGLKHHLRRTLGTSKLTFEEFSTVITKIEACLNSRPLTPLSENPDDLLPLTPGHFLIGNAPLSFPEADLTETPMNLLSRWQKLQAYQQECCRRWKEEYLHELHKRNKWQAPQRNLQIGDMVIVKKENLPPTLWRLGRVIQTHPGSDGQVRVATVRTETGNITRPIVKLCLLPIDDNSSHNYSNYFSTG